MSGTAVCNLPGHQGRNVINSKLPKSQLLTLVCQCFPSPVKRFSNLLSRKQYEHETQITGADIWRNLSAYIDFVIIKLTMSALNEEDSDMRREYLDTDIVVEDLSSPVQASRQEIKEGLELDVIDFLSNHGKTEFLVRSDGLRVPIDVVKNRYTLICCVALPLPTRSEDAECLRAMIDAHSEAKRYGNGFEMVGVANMKSGFERCEAAFDHFFSKLSCYSIPFSDYATRNYICTSLGLKIELRTPDLSAILVNERGAILWDARNTRNHFHGYGCELFPFRDKTVDAIRIQDDLLRMRLDPFYVRGPMKVSDNAMKDPLLQVPLSLYADILLCDHNRILERCHPDGGPGESVSELSNKCVGLYLCFDGDFLEKLHKVHQQCVENKQQLEIVVVFMAIFDDTKSYSKDLMSILELCNIKSWFVYYYDPMVCRRLWRVFGSEESVDKLIIIPPNCKSGELEGRACINQWERYPFTRSSFIEERVNDIKAFNLLAVFKRIYRGDSDLTPSELEGKKFLIYVDIVHYIPKEVGRCHQLKKHYPEIQAKGWEVVFVPRFWKRIEHIGPYFYTDMPWPTMPLPVAEAILSHLFDNDYYGDHLIAVGEDGVIRSRYGEELLQECGVTDSLFDDNLFEEMANQLGHIYDEDD